MKRVPDKLPDDLLDQAAAHLRACPVPEVPPQLLAAAAEAVLARQREGGGTFKLKREFPMKRILRIAAVLFVAAGIVGVAGFLMSRSATVAWADVAKQISNIQTLTFTMTMQVPVMGEMKVKYSFMEPGLMRQDWLGPQPVSAVVDMKAGIMLNLVPAQKLAMRFALSGLDEQARAKIDQENFANKFSLMAKEKGIEIGHREINGRAAKGFRVQQGQQTIDLWVDAGTGQPLEMSMDIPSAKTSMLCTEFRFNEPLAASLFSLEVPEGYKVQDMALSIKNPSIDDVVKLLSMWALVREGAFPDSIFETSRLLQDVMAAAKKGVKLPGANENMSKQEQVDLAQTIARAVVIINSSPTASYAGAGVKLGDAQTAIFWYKPEGSETYKVIYGDLHVTDVAEADLPAKPTTAPGGSEPATAPAE
jgi:outer membrane lipoprotein-sorting protein